VPSTFSSRSVCAILGETTALGEDPEIELGNYSFGEDPKIVLVVQLNEIPRLLESCKASSCTVLVLKDLHGLLKQIAQDYAACVLKPPPDRGAKNFDIRLTKGAQLFKQPFWGPERNLDAHKARVDWKLDLLQSGRGTLADPSEVAIISNVTTPISGGKFRPCGMYNALNDVIVPLKRVLLIMRDVIRDLSPNVGALWVSDVAKGFYSLAATPRAQSLMAVWSVTSPGKVLVPKVMMFGPTNTPAYFDIVMDEAMMGLPIKRVVDDHHGEGVFPTSAKTTTKRNEFA
jgi:hypothetical protein